MSHNFQLQFALPSEFTGEITIFRLLPVVLPPTTTRPLCHIHTHTQRQSSVRIHSIGFGKNY